MTLIDLAILFRALNLYSHHAHNMASGLTFFEDHEFFSEIYSFADGVYDDLIERQIGTVNDKINLIEIVSEASEMISKMKENYFITVLVLLEKSINDIDELCKDENISGGTKNLLEGHADKIETFIYKIKRRIK